MRPTLVSCGGESAGGDNTADCIAAHRRDGGVVLVEIEPDGQPGEEWYIPDRSFDAAKVDYWRAYVRNKWQGSAQHQCLPGLHSC